MLKKTLRVLPVLILAVITGACCSVHSEKPETASGLFINVREHGAAGDGERDDAPAIQKAIDTAAKTGGTVFFPVGKYRICKTLTIPGGKLSSKRPQNWITLRGAGGTGSQLLGDGVDYILKAVSGDEKYRYVSGIRVYELTFSSYSREKRCSAIDASAILRSYIEHCNFLFLNRGIHTFHANRKDSIWILRISNNNFNFNRDWAIDIQRAFDVVIFNNIIEAGRGGIKVGSPGDGLDAACNTLRIENNVIEGLSEVKDHPAILGSCWVGGWITGNYFEANGSGDIQIAPKEGDGWTRGLTITGNTFSPTKKQRQTTDYGPVLLQRVMDVQVTGNFTTGERLLHGKSGPLGRSISVQGNSLNNAASVSFDGLSPAERAEYEKKQISHRQSRNRIELGGQLKVGLDSESGLRFGRNAIRYSDTVPQAGNPGDVVFCRKPAVEKGRVVIGWYCVRGGDKPRWCPLSFATEDDGGKP